MTAKEKQVIEVLRLHVCNAMAENIRHENYPEEIGVPKGERPCDAIWRGAHGTYAVEHTKLIAFPDSGTMMIGFAD
jgi:hypothetical protein